MSDIRDVINNMERGKACALDGIFAEHLLYAGDRLPVLLTLLFNMCILHGYLPPQMISTVLIPIIKNKSGDVTDKGNYRPIALSSVISKVFEHIILDRIESFLYTTNNQFGFKAKHATDQCLYLLKEVIDYYKSHNSPMFICFMDASKAFDRVNHWTLFKKLILRGVPLIFIRLIVHWYRSQHVCVKWGSVVSSNFTVLNGVRQGGILSPWFFNIYIDDLSSILSSCNSGCKFGNQTINHISYADDLLIFYPSSKGLQGLLNQCEIYGTEHDIKYNKEKTVCMIIKPRGFKLRNSPDICLNGHMLSFVDSYKYLGVIMLSCFMDDDDIKRQVRALYIRGSFLARNFSFCSVDVKVKLFKSFCSNMYCCHLWSHFKNSSYNKVRVAYNNCFRILFGLPRYCSASHMFVSNYVMSFGELVRKCVFNFIKRIESSNNILIQCIILVTYQNSQLRKHWRDILYSSHTV